MLQCIWFFICRSRLMKKGEIISVTYCHNCWFYCSRTPISMNGFYGCYNTSSMRTNHRCTIVPKSISKKNRISIFTNLRRESCQNIDPWCSNVRLQNRLRLIHPLKYMFLVFKQHYTYFYISTHIFKQQNTCF